MKKLDDAFLNCACDVLAETNNGLSGSNIVKYCSSYALDFNRIIPYGRYPFDAPNKRTALYENILVLRHQSNLELLKNCLSYNYFVTMRKPKNLKSYCFRDMDS